MRSRLSLLAIAALGASVLLSAQPGGPKPRHPFLVGDAFARLLAAVEPGSTAARLEFALLDRDPRLRLPSVIRHDATGDDPDPGTTGGGTSGSTSGTTSGSTTGGDPTDPGDPTVPELPPIWPPPYWPFPPGSVVPPGSTWPPNWPLPPGWGPPLAPGLPPTPIPPTGPNIPPGVDTGVQPGWPPNWPLPPGWSPPPPGTTVPWPPGAPFPPPPGNPPSNPPTSPPSDPPSDPPPSGPPGNPPSDPPPLGPPGDYWDVSANLQLFMSAGAPIGNSGFVSSTDVEFDVLISAKNHFQQPGAPQDGPSFQIQGIDLFMGDDPTPYVLDPFKDADGNAKPYRLSYYQGTGYYLLQHVRFASTHYADGTPIPLHVRVRYHLNALSSGQGASRDGSAESGTVKLKAYNKGLVLDTRQVANRTPSSGYRIPVPIDPPDKPLPGEEIIPNDWDVVSPQTAAAARQALTGGLHHSLLNSTITDAPPDDNATLDRNQILPKLKETTVLLGMTHGEDDGFLASWTLGHDGFGVPPNAHLWDKLTFFNDIRPAVAADESITDVNKRRAVPPPNLVVLHACNTIHASYSFGRAFGMLTKASGYLVAYDDRGWAGFAFLVGSVTSDPTLVDRGLLPDHAKKLYDLLSAGWTLQEAVKEANSKNKIYNGNTAGFDGAMSTSGDKRMRLIGVYTGQKDTPADPTTVAWRLCLPPSDTWSNDPNQP